MQQLANVSLKDYTSLHAGGTAERLWILENDDDLLSAATEAATNGPIWTLGYGSNCLVSDKGLPGTVLINKAGTLTKLSNTRFKVSSGISWDTFVQFIIDNGVFGLEFTSGIPGGTGAAIVGNIAAYGQKVADCFIEATVLNPLSGNVETWQKEQLGFTYRSSALQLEQNQGLVLLDAVFELSEAPTTELEYESALKNAQELGIKPDTLQHRRQIILETRRKAGSLLQDNEAGPWTAGSFFKNPLVDDQHIEAIISHEEAPLSREQLLKQNRLHGGTHLRVSAAHVLLAAGFKRGQTWGNVRLHPDHILKIENLGNASAQEIYEVMRTIIQTVHQKFNITLEPEVRLLGEF